MAGGFALFVSGLVLGLVLAHRVVNGWFRWRLPEFS